MAENETGRPLAGGTAGDVDHAGKLICSPNNAPSTRRQRLPNRRNSEIVEFEHENRRYRATVSRFADGRVGEIFLDVGKFGADLQLHAQDSAILASLAMQSGVPVNVIIDAIKGPISTALRNFGADQ